MGTTTIVGGTDVAAVPLGSTVLGATKAIFLGPIRAIMRAIGTIILGKITFWATVMGATTPGKVAMGEIVLETDGLGNNGLGTKVVGTGKRAWRWPEETAISVC